MADEPTKTGYGDMQTGLQIFYVLIILSAVVILAELIIKGLLNIFYLRLSTAKSLHNYHDSMLEHSNSWMYPWVDLEFAFKMQSFEYKRGKLLPEQVCEEYKDLVWYLYMHEGGFEAAEAALGDSDSYVRQAAANMVGFWAVLETTLGEVQGGYRLPLKFQRGLLSKLADVAEQSRGQTGMAAAGSIALLLQGEDPVGMATEVTSEGAETSLVAILVERVNQLLPPHNLSHSLLGDTLRAEARTHIHALLKLLQQLKVAAPAPAPGIGPRASIFTQAQREQIVKEMQQSLLQDNSAFNMSGTSAVSVDDTIHRLERYLERLVPAAAAAIVGFVVGTLIEPL